MWSSGESRRSVSRRHGTQGAYATSVAVNQLVARMHKMHEVGSWQEPRHVIESIAIELAC